MPLDTINILIGAGIALVASVTTAIITHILQAQSERQKRKWEIEDRKREKRYEIERGRLAEAEEWANGYIRFFDEARSHLTTLVGKLSNSNEFQQWMKAVAETPKIHSYGRAILYRIGDSELQDIAGELNRHWVEIIKVMNLKPTGLEQVDTVGLAFVINSIFEDALKTHGDFIKRLDQIKISLDS